MSQMPHLGNPTSGVTLCIEDPLDASNDVGRGSFYFYRVKEAFEDAYIILTRLCSGAIPQGTKRYKVFLFLQRCLFCALIMRRKYCIRIRGR